MKFIYKNRPEDGIAFQRYVWRNSKQTRKILVSAGVRAPILGAILVGIIAWLSASVLFAGISGFLLLFYTVYIWYYFRINVFKRMRSYYTDEYQSGFEGEHTIEIGQDGILHSTADSSSKIAWRLVSDVEFDGEYCFIHLGKAKALIIPRSSVTGGDVKSFVEQARNHWRDTRTPAT